ncbi:protein of unknown function [Petrocella atlantisensis]|uniref:Uncharacterized protein n=1 Tax=Petrocella atlantisensis TaxID=2173034 RepID=A0A3P7RWM3_9FIRM|nr:hypothetical protein [Petrocella atlantisensis]VDN47082.1 protein of unknown function [Petrocella atlantisensis]
MKLIFGHSGIYQIREVIELMKEYPNIYAEISTQPHKNIRMLIDEVGVKGYYFLFDYHVNDSGTFGILISNNTFVIKSVKNDFCNTSDKITQDARASSTEGTTSLCLSIQDKTN